MNSTSKLLRKIWRDVWAHENKWRVKPPKRWASETPQTKKKHTSRNHFSLIIHEFLSLKLAFLFSYGFSLCGRKIESVNMPSFIFYHCDNWEQSYSLLQLQFGMFKEISMLLWPPGDKQVSCLGGVAVLTGDVWVRAVPRPRAGELMGSTTQCYVGWWPEHRIQGLKKVWLKPWFSLSLLRWFGFLIESLSHCFIHLKDVVTINEVICEQSMLC